MSRFSELRAAALDRASSRRRLYSFHAPRARRPRVVSIVFSLLFLIALSCAVSSTFAAEEQQAFLDALKARGYDDVALVYLKQLQASGEALPEIDGEIDYKIGAAAFDAWLKAPSSTRASLADQALAAFKKYLEASPDGPSAFEANFGAARLLIDQGDRALADSNKKNVKTEDAANLKQRARGSYSEAKPYLAAALKLAQTRAKERQADESGPVDALQQAQASYLDALIRSATLQAQTARTFEIGSEEHKTGLTKAREAFEKIADQYGQYAGSFKARYLAAEAAHELGDDDSALTWLEELSVVPSEDNFFPLKTRGLLLYAEIADAQASALADADAETAQKSACLDMGLAKKFNDWKNVDKYPSEYYVSAEGLRIALLAGKAAIRLEKMRQTDFNRFANAGKKTFIEATDPFYKKMNVPANRGTKGNTVVLFAAETLCELAAGRGTVATEAQNLLNDKIFAELDLSKYSFAKKIKVDDFDSAFDAASRASAAFKQISDESKIAAPDAIADAKRDVKETGEKTLETLRDALLWGEKALRPDRKGKLSADDKASAQSRVDSLYMKYAVVAFALERYEDAYAAGEYLAKRRSDSEFSSQGAIVALRSLQSIAVRLRAEDAAQETQDAFQNELDAFSNYIAERWSDESDDSAIALEAAIVRLDSAVADGDVESAKSLLAKIPENSPRRAGAELRVGQSLWNEWARRGAEIAEARQNGEELDETALNAQKETMKSILDAAEEALRNGLERKITSTAGVNEQDYLAIYSTYLLAQVYDKLDRPEDVEKWLSHPVIGARTIVERSFKSADDPEALDLADAPEFINESFQLAALSLTLSVVVADPERLEEAENIMTTLESLAEGSDENSGKLTGVYVRLGRRLEERVDELKEKAETGDGSQQAALDSVVKGFEAFLKRVAERNENADFTTLRWVADSYLALGRGLSGVTSDPPKEALAYYAQAVRAYQSILKKIGTDPNFAPSPAHKTAIEIKASECLRRAGQFELALKFLGKTIDASPNNLDVQIEAASIYADWGRKNNDQYLKAIVGDQAKIWGWNGIIKRAAPQLDKDERYKKTFYDAYVEKTRCRYQYARKLKDKDKRVKQAQDAEADLERLCQTRPDMGGAEYFGKFNSAYKNFQKLRGEKNLRGLRDKAKSKTSAPTDGKKA